MTIIKLDIHQALREALGDTTVHAPASIDLQELVEFTDAKDITIDLHDELARQQCIAVVWGVGDVQSSRPDLNDQQAWSVLQAIAEGDVCTAGITWETIQLEAEQQFGTAKQHRIKRCTNFFGIDDSPDVIDVLVDAMHWCQLKGRSFDEAIRFAKGVFDAELNSDSE